MVPMFFLLCNGFCVSVCAFSTRCVQNSSSLAAFSQNKPDLIAVLWFTANCPCWSHVFPCAWLFLGEFLDSISTQTLPFSLLSGFIAIIHRNSVVSEIVFKFVLLSVKLSSTVQVKSGKKRLTICSISDFRIKQTKWQISEAHVHKRTSQDNKTDKFKKTQSEAFSHSVPAYFPADSHCFGLNPLTWSLETQRWLNSWGEEKKNTIFYFLFTDRRKVQKVKVQREGADFPILSSQSKRSKCVYYQTNSFFFFCLRQVFTLSLGQK